MISPEQSLIEKSNFDEKWWRFNSLSFKIQERIVYQITVAEDINNSFQKAVGGILNNLYTKSDAEIIELNKVWEEHQ
jgi:hypothetical protein